MIQLPDGLYRKLTHYDMTSLSGGFDTAPIDSSTKTGFYCNMYLKEIPCSLHSLQMPTCDRRSSTMRSPLLPLSECLPSVDSKRQMLTAKSISFGKPDMSDRSRLAYSLGRTSFGRPSISRVDSATSQKRRHCC